MKYSKQRNMVMETVINNPIHPTAEQVYAILRKQCPTISLGTVYRNLNFLSEIGTLRKIPVSDGCDRFDARLDRHFHAICDDCGVVYDVDLPIPLTLEQDVLEQDGFSVRQFDVTLKGVCKSCTEQRESAEEKMA
jgi:Fe2+ or Zn2+ uptake regulation protein